MANSPEPPALNEIEVSVFGPGYGEAIAMHVGGGKWIIVDSCIDPGSNSPAPLRYLYDLGVSPEAVQLVVATHWHDDHVCGISTVFERCTNAGLVVSEALNSDEFLRLLSIYGGNQPIPDMGVDEFARVFHLLQMRRQKGVRFNAPKFASADRTVYSDRLHLDSRIAEISVCTLSPSDSAILQAKFAFKGAFPVAGQKRLPIASPKPNHAAVVLWITVDSHHMLLGADLQETADCSTGWTVIASASSTIRSNKASIYKVPHHGSRNAHSQKVWSDLLISDPIAILTPFRRGVPLCRRLKMSAESLRLRLVLI